MTTKDIFFQHLNWLDSSILIWINHSLSSYPLNYIFFGLSFSASWIGILLYGGAAILFMKDQKWKAQFLFTLILTGVVFESLKILINRQRPYEMIHLITPYGTKGLDASFPSGHSSFAFAIASTVTRKSISIFYYAWAFAVGLSRLYLGVHYPSDVLGGIVVGVFTGKIVKLVSGGKYE